MTPDPKPTEALKPWHPGPAQGGENIWQDGDVLLIAVDTNQGWDFALVSITADEDSASMRDPETGDFRSEWGFEDIHYWIRREDIPKLWSADRDAELAAMRSALEGLKSQVAVTFWTIRNGEQSSADAESLREEVSNAMGNAFETAEHALTSTAGTEILERLRLAVEERDQARIERDTEQQFRQRSDAKLAAVTAELEQIKKSK